jgi:hypothetical protein
LLRRDERIEIAAGPVELISFPQREASLLT